MRRPVRTVIMGLVFAALALAWWFPAYDWLNAQPAGYRMAFSFIGFAVVAGACHTVAMVRYHRMTKLIHEAEKAGFAAPGSTLFAANQRYRYVVRVFEALWVLGLGVLVVIAFHHPEITTNPNYGRYVLTYFFGSIAVTAWLTVRDLWVLKIVQNIDRHAKGAALAPILDDDVDIEPEPRATAI